MGVCNHDVSFILEDIYMHFHWIFALKVIVLRWRKYNAWALEMKKEKVFRTC